MNSPGIALSDLKNFASNTASMDDIISLDISDIGSGGTHNLDMSLLGNHGSPSPKTNVNATPYSPSGTTFNISSRNPSPPKHSFISDGIDFINIEDTQKTVSVNPPTGIGADTIRINRFKEEPAIRIDTDIFNIPSASAGPTVTIDETVSEVPSVSVPKLSAEQEATEKSAIINKIRRLASKGIEGNRLTMANSLDEIKTEYARLVDSRNLESSIKFQRSTLLTCATGLEFLNQKFNPLDVNLDGWSESINENQEDFDEIFEELYDKYKDKTKVAPEIRLVMTLGISAAMCHVTNTFFKSKMPGMDDILKRNPDLARQFAQAAAGQAVGPGFANFVSMGMPQGQQNQNQSQQQQQQQSQQNQSQQNQSQQQQQQQQSQQNQHQYQQEPEPFIQHDNSETWGQHQIPVIERSPPSPAVHTARREMKGPTGVEDILKAFESEDRGAPVLGFIPPSRPDFEDNQSVYTSTTMNGSESHAARKSGRGGKRKTNGAPVGATIDLRV